jgi:hypothetical protein
MAIYGTSAVSQGTLTSVSVADIIVGPDRRRLRSETVGQLAESIAARGAAASHPLTPGVLAWAARRADAPQAPVNENAPGAEAAGGVSVLASSPGNDRRNTNRRTIVNERDSDAKIDNRHR